MVWTGLRRLMRENCRRSFKDQIRTDEIIAGGVDGLVPWTSPVFTPA
jgi:hypothetical protein